MRFIVAALSVGFLVSQASASLDRSNLIRSLHARQLIDPSQIPPECQDICTPVLNTVNSCGQDFSCLCAAEVDTGITNCLSCAVSADPTGEKGAQAQASNLAQTYQQVCAAAGSPVASVVLSSVALTPSSSAPDSVSVSGSATTDGGASGSVAPSGSSARPSASPTAPPSASRSASGSGNSSGASRTSSGSGTPSPSGNSAAPIKNGLEGVAIAGIGSLFMLLGF